MNKLCWISTLLLVAACRGETPPSENNTGGGGNAATAASADVPDEAADGANAIPEAFHGTWDRDAAACASRSEMRLEISSDALRFHESVGRVTDVQPEGESDLFVSASFEGEGESWSRDLLLSLEGDGNLTVTQLEEPAVSRVRCT